MSVWLKYCWTTSWVDGILDGSLPDSTHAPKRLQIAVLKPRRPSSTASVLPRRAAVRLDAVRDDSNSNSRVNKQTTINTLIFAARLEFDIAYCEHLVFLQIELHRSSYSHREGCNRRMRNLC
jgi:hypothetical protein